MIKSFNYYRRKEVQQKALHIVRRVLLDQKNTIFVEIKKKNKHLIDIFWIHDVLIKEDICVYGDKSGPDRYYFETCADIEKQILGKILYSRAEYLYYVFLGIDPIQIHVIKLSKLCYYIMRNWTLLNNKRIGKGIGKVVEEEFLDEKQGWVKTIRIKNPGKH